MNGRLPRVTADQLLRALMRAGWYIYRQRGSHATLAHPTKRGTVTIARHRGRTVKPKTLAAILVQAGLTVDEFVRLLCPYGFAKEGTMRRYTVVLLPDPDEGGFTVTVPAVPGCVTEGETLDEALANAREALQLHLEVLADRGEPIPEESPPAQVATVEV